MGFRCRVLTVYEGQDCDALVALHAVKTYRSQLTFRQAHPQRPVLVAITGTDIHGIDRDIAVTHHALHAATRIILLHEQMIPLVPEADRAKCNVIIQSASAPRQIPPPDSDRYDVCVLGHLRPVKDPFLAARAARLLPRDSRIRIHHFGEALSSSMADLARREMRENPRYLWHGSVPHARALQELARSRVMVLTSKAEGGPAAISESLACRVPILATRIDASVGLLGEEYPGLFPVGDHVELARRLTQCENGKSYVRKLQRACDRRRPLVDPEFERAAWKSLLESLGLTAH